MKIGIQGDLGSNNHSVAIHFAKKKHWSDYEIIPLRTTKAVLSALSAKTVDYGTFAWESASGGLVAETQKAINDYRYSIVDEIVTDIEHALLKQKNSSINKNDDVFIYSHPQALIEHKPYLTKTFPRVNLCGESDTGFAAKQLSKGAYPENSLVIAQPLCAEVYNLEVLQHDIPYEKEAWTRFFLVSL